VRATVHPFALLGQDAPMPTALPHLRMEPVGIIERLMDPSALAA
jgi:hypothetical protein